jgi:hypothetical protein
MKRLLLAAVMSVVGLANAAPVSGFNGDYAVANWTQSAGTGAINTAGAPNSISLTSGDDGSFEMSYTNFYIQFAVDTTVTFSWAYSTSTSPRLRPIRLCAHKSTADLESGFEQQTDDASGVHSPDNVCVRPGRPVLRLQHLPTTLAALPPQRSAVSPSTTAPS